MVDRVYLRNILMGADAGAPPPLFVPLAGGRKADRANRITPVSSSTARALTALSTPGSARFQWSCLRRTISTACTVPGLRWAAWSLASDSHENRLQISLRMSLGRLQPCPGTNKLPPQVTASLSLHSCMPSAHFMCSVIPSLRPRRPRPSSPIRCVRTRT